MVSISSCALRDRSLRIGTCVPTPNKIPYIFMKTPTIYRFLPVCGLAAALYFGAAATSQATVAMSWSGGSGAPLSVTFAYPIVFNVVTAAGVDEGPAVDMVGIGNLFGDIFPSATGVSITINGGSSLSITNWNSGHLGIDAALTDVYFFGIGAIPGVAVGDVVTVSAGTLTGLDPYAGAAPTTTSTEMYLVNYLGQNISSPGTSVVPEPSAALLGGLGLLGLLRRRR